MNKKIDKTLKLSNRFSLILRAWLTLDQMKQVVTGVLDSDGNPFEVQDFCDANMAMHEAFLYVYNRESDGDSDADITLWNAAWDLSKKNKFEIL